MDDRQRQAGIGQHHDEAAQESTGGKSQQA